MATTDPDIYLASRSPRRQELLAQIGVRFSLVLGDVDETPLPAESPTDYVQRLAVAKAISARSACANPSLPVLGADTAVVLGDDILGKPVDRRQAAVMLHRLSGREHQVMTAVALVGADSTDVCLSVSRVRFAPLTEQQINHYVSSGEADDKAGAYAIQGRAAVFVEHIEGSYSGIVGLPLFETAQLLKRHGIQIG